MDNKVRQFLFQEFLELSGLFLKFLGFESVTSGLDDVQSGILVELLGSLRVVNQHHLILVALNDENWTTILADDIKSIHIVNLLEETTTHLHVPQVGHLGNIREFRIAGTPVFRNAEGWEYEYQLTDLILHLSSGEG